MWWREGYQIQACHDTSTGDCPFPYQTCGETEARRRHSGWFTAHPWQSEGKKSVCSFSAGVHQLPSPDAVVYNPRRPSEHLVLWPWAPGVRLLLVEAAAAAAADRSRVLPRYSISLGLRFHLPAPWQPSNYPIKFIYYFMNT